MQAADIRPEEFDQLDEFAALLDAEAHWQRYNRLYGMFEPGPLGIDKYPRHRECFADGARFRTRCFMGGNGTGKTFGVGSFETALHLTGEYPPWWDGLRFEAPIDAWVGGDTRETVRDTLQKYLLGNFAELGVDEYGTGLIPRHLLGKPVIVGNTGNAVDYVKVRHRSGRWSTLGFKSYEQGRKKWQGTNKHWIWMDEEPPEGIYLEALQRGRGVNGRLLLTYTPLSGYTKVVESMLAWETLNKQGASIKTTSCAWGDVPHLDEEWKRNTRAQTPVHLRKAREMGIPTSGIGMVYPVEEEQFVISPIPLPAHWRRCFGFDGGWHNTACLWVAYDKDEDTVYVYADYKRGEVPVEVHATAIKARGAWIPGVGDAAASNEGGPKLVTRYVALGVRMQLPDKSAGSVDAGIQEVFSRLISGRLKIFSTCQKLLDEIRRYRYDEKQQIVKHNDHLMDALRYVVVDGLKLATTQRLAPPDITEEVRF